MSYYEYFNSIPKPIKATYLDHKKIYRTFALKKGQTFFIENEVTYSNKIFEDNKISKNIFSFLKLMDSDNLPSQLSIPENLRDTFIILNNKKEYGGTGDNEIWETAKYNENASMSAYHSFLCIKPKISENNLIDGSHWSLFNALTFGEDPKFQTSLDVLRMLNTFELIGKNWAKENGIQNLGLYFHIYPRNSINSLHLHMIDTSKSRTGVAFKKYKNVNIPLEEIKQYFLNISYFDNFLNHNKIISINEDQTIT